jgi:hypothetical protein
VISDPAAAPARPDLTFLRRRAKPRPVPADPALGEFLSGHATHAHPHRERSAEPVAAPSAPTSPAPSAGDLLDLTPVAAAESTPRPAPAPAATRPAATRVRRDVRVRAGQQRIVSGAEPTVTLTRVQSGIGQLEIEAVCSPAVGDVRLGAAYQLASGPTSTVQYTNRFAPSSRRPVLLAGREEYEHLRVDLRQVRDLERLAVFAFSESRAELTWGGTLVVSTFGGARVELPLESLHPGRVAVLMTIYNVDGELVLRAELETVDGDVREAARAYGFDRITWRDDRSPVD